MDLKNRFLNSFYVILIIVISTDEWNNVIGMGLNYVINTLFSESRSAVRTAYNYMTAGASSYVLDRLFGRSIVTNNNTRAVAGENANFLDSALRVVNTHNNFVSGNME